MWADSSGGAGMTSLLCLSQKCLVVDIISFLFLNYIPSVGNWENAGKHEVCGEFHSLPFCELIEQHETWGLVSILCSHHTGVSLQIICSVPCLLLWTVVIPPSSLGDTQVRICLS